MSELLLRDETHQILGACFDVYKHMSCGFLEAVYQDCLAIEFGLRRIPFIAQPTVKLTYKRHLIEHTYQQMRHSNFFYLSAALLCVPRVPRAHYSRVLLQ